MADPPRQPPNYKDKIITKKAPLPVRRTQVLGNVIIDPDRWYGPPESEILERAGRISPPLLDTSRTDRPLVPSPRPPGQSSRPREHPGFSLTALDSDVSEGRSNPDASEGRSNSTSSISPILPVSPNPLRPSPLGEASTPTGQSAVSGTTLAGSLQSPRSGGTMVLPNIGNGTSTSGPSFSSSQTAQPSSTSGNPLTQPNVSNAPNIRRTRSQLVRHYISQGMPIPQEVLDMPETPRVRRRDWLPRKFRNFKEWCRRIARRD